jgi:hypothetical protein
LAASLHPQADLAQAFLKIVVGGDRDRVEVGIVGADAAGQRAIGKSLRKCRKNGIE